MNYPENLRYTKEHEWADLISPTTLKVGITHHAQSSLGDVVYLELPEAGRELKANDTFGVVESIKAVSDLFCPVNGKVIEVNSPLKDDPIRINNQPHEEWMLILESPTAKADFENLLTAAQYSDYVKTLT